MREEYCRDGVDRQEESVLASARDFILAVLHGLARSRGGFLLPCKMSRRVSFFPTAGCIVWLRNASAPQIGPARERASKQNALELKPAARRSSLVRSEVVVALDLARGISPVQLRPNSTVLYIPCSDE